MECLRILAGVIVVVALFINKTFESNKDLQKYATSSASLLFLVGEWAIRKRIWRYTDPRVDLHGEWDGTSTFEACEPAATTALPSPVSYKVLFEQDCLSIKIAPTHADYFVNWGSDSLNVDDDGNIVFAYHVRYSTGPFPPDATGVERLDVVQRDSRGYPMVMKGTFAQTARGAYPVYRGRVEYTRSSKGKSAAKARGKTAVKQP